MIWKVSLLGGASPFIIIFKNALECPSIEKMASETKVECIIHYLPLVFLPLVKVKKERGERKQMD